VIPGRPALLVWRGDSRPSRTAPLGMTKTPTLRVSADLLDLKAAHPLPGPSLGVPEREVESRLRTTLTLDKPVSAATAEKYAAPTLWRQVPQAL